LLMSCFPSHLILDEQIRSFLRKCLKENMFNGKSEEKCLLQLLPGRLFVH
jgi:hypothetical protein